MRRVAVIAAAAVATGLIVGVVIAGSGNDGSSDRQVTSPELTPPGGSRTTETDTGTTRGEDGTGPEAPDGSDQGQQHPQDQSGGAQAPQEDTPGNDTPPPKGSPAERFEQFCEDNPGAC